MSSPFNRRKITLYVAEKTNTKHICVTKEVMVQYYIMMKMYSNTGYEIGL
jgi:hypothetical protein